MILWSAVGIFALTLANAQIAILRKGMLPTPMPKWKRIVMLIPPFAFLEGVWFAFKDIPKAMRNYFKD